MALNLGGPVESSGMTWLLLFIVLSPILHELSIHHYGYLHGSAICHFSCSPWSWSKSSSEKNQNIFKCFDQITCFSQMLSNMNSPHHIEFLPEISPLNTFCYPYDTWLFRTFLLVATDDISLPQSSSSFLTFNTKNLLTSKKLVLTVAMIGSWCHKHSMPFHFLC